MTFDLNYVSSICMIAIYASSQQFIRGADDQWALASCPWGGESVVKNVF